MVKIKRIFILIMVFISVITKSSLCQSTGDYMNKKVYLGFAPAVVFPTGNFSNTHKTGINYDLFAGVPITKSFALTVQFGGSNMKGKEIDGLVSPKFSTSYVTFGGTYRLDKLLQRTENKTSFNLFATIGPVWDKNNLISNDDVIGDFGVDWIIPYQKKYVGYTKIGLACTMIQQDKSASYFPKLSVGFAFGFFDKKNKQH